MAKDLPALRNLAPHEGHPLAFPGTDYRAASRRPSPEFSSVVALSEDGPLPTPSLMPESSPENPPPTVYAHPWAVRLGFALMAAFTLILGLAYFDNARRKELETVSETTAVGDAHLFEAPTDPARLPAVGAVLNGEPLYVANVTAVEVRDTHTRRAGSDATRGLAIYGLSSAATDAERARVGTKRGAFLLKVGVNRFVIAGPADK